MKPIILSLFDYTGNMVLPWVESGRYEAVCVDLQGNDDIPGINRIVADINTWVPPKDIIDRVCFVSAAVPCTHLAISGSRWMKGKGLGALADSIKLFERAAFWGEWFDVPYMIENPVSTISTYWRKPDYKFHPCHYSGYCADDQYTKETCLWTGNGFVMPSRDMDLFAEVDKTKIHHAPPGEERANFRSETPSGFCQAVFEANG